MDVQKQIKSLMFKYIREGVGARGVSILATKTIIDSIKVIHTYLIQFGLSDLSGVVSSSLVWSHIVFLYLKSLG